MGEPFLAEIKVVSFNFAPRGWAFCNGQLLPINQNQALFALLGTTYGGNGQTTFALPDLRDRIPVHAGGAHDQGEKAGEIAHTVTTQEMPQHIHSYNGVTDPADQFTPAGNFLAATDPVVFGSVYGPAQSLEAMAPQMVSNTGGSQPHNNLHPVLTLNFIIALQGIFPSRN
jgi:microcystin-dependent protein